MGKTSTRDAITAVLQTQYRVRSSQKNLNNEFGLPLTILGFSSPGRNILGWLQVFVSGYLHAWFTLDFPRVLVLEMGIDKPGDMDYLLSIVKPDIAVLTWIGSSHYEFFKSERGVAEEKIKLIKALDKQGVAVLNVDSEKVKQQQNFTRGQILTYSTQDSSADVYAEVRKEHLELPARTQLKVSSKGAIFELTINAVGAGHYSAVAAAVAVGKTMGIDSDQLAKGLANYRSEPGRMKFLKGLRKTLLIDDSYNASPESMHSALEVLPKVQRKIKVVVLGDMLELGNLAIPAHQEIGRQVAKLNPSFLYTVGALGKVISQKAIESGFDESRAVHFENSVAAGEYLRQNLPPESVILIKGSQSMRMEKISKELLAEPMTAGQVLPRQYGGWLKS